MNEPFLPEGAKILSIGELTREVKGLIEGTYPRGVWVVGEVSNLTKHTSGHWYLTLKDKDSQLRTVIFRGVNLRLKFDLRAGLEVVAHGRLSVYVPRGEYQLEADQVYPKGEGALDLAFRQLKEKLSRLGYFEPQRKKPLPRFPRRVALVTSPTGAAVQDMLKILVHRWPAVEVWVCPVHVQGDGAAGEIAEMIRLINRLGEIDVMVVGRGGGSLEDLWAFNEEVVAQAIYESVIPVVSGVGHETDYTIADLVADCRGNTPTHAAALVVPDRSELAEGFYQLGQRLRMLVQQRLSQSRQQLQKLAQRRVLREPLDRVREAERRLDDWSERVQRAAQQRLVQLRERLDGRAARLGSLSPLNVLARGYSLSRRETDQVVVRDPAQVKPGDRLVTLVQHGRILSQVEQTQGPPAPAASDSSWMAPSGVDTHE